MRTTLRLVSTLLIPLVLITACCTVVAPVPAHADEEKITLFEPESAESEAASDDNDEDKTSWVPWVISASVLGFIAAGFAGTKQQTDSGSGGGSIDVGW